MKENEIVELALENLEKNTGIAGKWNWTEHLKGKKQKKTFELITKEKGKVQIEADYHRIDGHVELAYNEKHGFFAVEVKRELRNKDLPVIVNMAWETKNFMIIAQRIFPNVKQELRKEHIAYLEANGDAYLQNDDFFILIENHKPTKTEKDQPNRAFTKTGLKVIFNFLMDENIINRTYREIAEITGTGLGNVPNVINGLQEAGFILKVTKNEYKLARKKELFEKWINAYEERLKPTLEMGTFRFLKQEDFINWKNIRPKHPKTLWGGEPAGDLLTNYLKPAILTLYTNETKTELIKNYKLIPDPEGNVKAYKKFWNYNVGKSYDTVPPQLVYADLMNTGDRRCIETAQKIYNELLQDKF